MSAILKKWIDKNGKAQVEMLTTKQIIDLLIESTERDERIRKTYSEVLKKRGTAKWVGGEIGKCSKCGHTGCASDIWNGCKRHFCPNCGAEILEWEI